MVAVSACALEMQRQDRVLSARWWVTEFVQEFLGETLALSGHQVKDQAERVIRYLCDRSGLLVERGTDVFGFSHRTFQEYFAAHGILQEAGEGKGDAVALLRPYLYHPRWEEVVPLVSAGLPPAQATALLRTILDDLEPAGRFLKRGLQLALRCLADGAAVADRRLLEQVFSAGSVIGESKWLGVSLRIIAILRDLKVTRHAADAGKMLADIESAAKRELKAHDFLCLYRALHEPLWPTLGADAPPGKVYRKQVNGHQVDVIAVGRRLLHDEPKRWYAKVFRLLRSRTTSEVVKRSFIDDLLAGEADRNDEVRTLLEDVLQHDRNPGVRAVCAWALQRAAVKHPSTADLLVRTAGRGRMRQCPRDLCCRPQ